jgi:hypothetical protein
MTAATICHFTRNGIPALTTHDSYISQNKYTGELNAVMSNAVEGFFGYKIPIDQHGLGLDRVQAFNKMDRLNPFVSSVCSDIKTVKKSARYLKRLSKFRAAQESC